MLSWALVLRGHGSKSWAVRLVSSLAESDAASGCISRTRRQ
jgi:hypothetical protein